MMNALRAVIILLACGALGGCVGPLQEVGREPSLTPVGSGLYSENVVPSNYLVTESLRSNGNSAWRDNGADLFRDGRAVRPGDVVTVKIQIKDKASLDNTLERSRDSKAGLDTGLDYDLGFGGWTSTGSGTIKGDIGRTTSTDSKGAIARSESIDLLVAAVVTSVLPNGNLLISGTQEVRVNFEVRVLNVAGVIRPRDIAQDNSISYDKLAEARISYGGRGRVTEIQQPGWGHQIVDIISPF
jgi:flagellar L-ring protein precursor FlgH